MGNLVSESAPEWKVKNGFIGQNHITLNLDTFERITPKWCIC